MTRLQRLIRLLHAFVLGCLLAQVLGPVPAAQGAPTLSRESEHIQPRLLQLIDEYDRHGETGLRQLAADRGIQLRESSQGALIPILLELRPGFSTHAIDPARIEALGGHVDAVSASFIRVLVLPRDARRLVNLPEVRTVRSPATVKEFSLGFGNIVSEAVPLTGASTLQGLGITGSGVKVAVVDVGFRRLSEAIAVNELPANTISVDFTGLGVETGSQHGVAVAEEVVDMAPGIQLYCLKVSDEADLENAAAYLRTNGIRIANLSLGFFGGSYYDDTGPFNTVINTSHDTDGVFWSVAAGNSAQSHWRGTWSDPDGDQRLNFSATANAITLQGFDASVSRRVVICLNWNQYGNSVTDLDLYVIDKSGNTVTSSTNPQNGPQEPLEELSFQYDPSKAPYRVVVVHASGPTAGLDVTLFATSNVAFDFAVPASSFVDPADAHGATTVGAIEQTSYAILDPALETFSSHGPTTDGRNKPDFCAPDDTSDYIYGLGTSLALYQGGQWALAGPNSGFSGTSASAPVVAGGAALLLQQMPSLTASGLLSAFANLSLPISSPSFGPTPLCGSGRFLVDQTTGTAPVSNLQNMFSFGWAGAIPLYGDWNGDGVATAGVFDPTTATWYLRNEPGPGNPDLIFRFGPAGSIPVVGDWNGKGTTTIGVFVPSTAQWYLRYSNSPGAPDLSFRYGFPGVLPVVGDWKGDKVDKVGVYYPPSGKWLLRNSPGGGPADLVFSFGYAGTQPIVGDWLSQGKDGIGVFDPSSGTLLLRFTPDSGSPDITESSPGAAGTIALPIPPSSPDLAGIAASAMSIQKGAQVGLFDRRTGEWILEYGHASNSPVASFAYGGAGTLPVYGDWNGDGVATPGAFDPTTATWYLRNTPGPGPAEMIFQFGPVNSIPVVGDWDGDGTTTVGVFSPSTSEWYLRNLNSAGNPDLVFRYGWTGVTPVVGNWTNGRADSIGVYDSSTGRWLLRNNPSGGTPDLVFFYGFPGTQPIVGDWSASGRAGIGVYDPSSGLFWLRNSVSPGVPDLTTSIGGGITGRTAVVWQP